MVSSFNYDGFPKERVSNSSIEIPVVQPDAVKDPTGCGDAYRGGLLFGLMQGWDWLKVGRVASLMGAVKIECHGTQNHSFSMEDFERRFQNSFGSALR